MRKFFSSLFGVFTVLAAALCAVFLFCLLRAPVFEPCENYVFYLGKDSSAPAVVTDAPLLAKWTLGEVGGESASYSGDRLKALREQFRAELLFCEEAGGVTSYYFRSPLLGRGVMLDGREVNLQIAVGRGRTAVGTPLIFGSF